jgi:hypothetical protein
LLGQRALQETLDGRFIEQPGMLGERCLAELEVDFIVVNDF